VIVLGTMYSVPASELLSSVKRVTADSAAAGVHTGHVSWGELTKGAYQKSLPKDVRSIKVPVIMDLSSAS